MHAERYTYMAGINLWCCILFIKQIKVEYPSAPKRFLLTPRRGHMGRSIARGSKKTLIDDCYDDPKSRHYMLKKLARVLKDELKTMSRVDTGSILRSGYDAMVTFKWELLLRELEAHAPVLNTILHSCTATRKQRSNRNATIGVCASIILKYRCSRMSLVQKMVMLLLHSSHCGKLVRVK